MQIKNTYDVVIIGGGIAGLTLAHLLNNTALQVAVIDKSLPTKTPDSAAALRVSAITPASKAILADLTLWQTRLSTFNKMHVWTPEGSYLDFNSAEINTPVLGYIIENHLLQTALYQALANSSNIAFMAAQVQEINFTNNDVKVVTNNATFNTPLLVGADGANSIVRQLSHIELAEQDYGHTSIIATVATELPHQQTAWQCFLPTGPLAFLPLADMHTVSIVWSTSAVAAEQLLAMNDETFCAELAKAFSYKLGNIKAVSKRLNFILRRRHAKQYIKTHMALIGDAAHTIHPLAGQGLNLGILDADYLAKVIVTAHQQKRNIGSFSNLRQYERARKAGNSLMFSVVDGLKQLFGTSATPVKFVRNTGMDIVNNLAFVKKFLLKQAIGIRE